MRLQNKGEFIGFGDPAAETANEEHAEAASREQEGLAKRNLKKVHETVKLFFRKRMEKLELVLFTFPPNLLIVAAHEEAKELNHELLFIDMQKVVVPPKEQLEEEARNRMSRAEEASKRAGFDAMLETVQNEAVANWVLKRITLGKNQVGIKRLDADEYEGDATLPDPGIGKYVPRAEPRVKIDMDSFMGDISAVQQQSAESRRATTAARRMSQQLTVAIDAFSSLAAGKNGLGKGSVRNKYVRAVLRWIRKQQVKEMSDMLDANAFYQDLLKKQAQERAAEAAG